MKRILLLLITMISAYWIISCGLSDDTVAKVGSMKISVDEYKAQLAKRFPNQTSYTEVDSAQKYAVLNNMIDQKRKVNAAYDLDLDDEPALIQELKRQRDKLLWNAYFEKNIVDRVISEEELVLFYSRTSEQVKASHILIAFEGARGSRSTRSEEEAIKLANDLAARVKNGEDIAELAKKYSDDPSVKQNNGSLGYFTWGRMVEEFQEAAFGLEVGQSSDPVKTIYGFHIIKVDDRRDNPEFDPVTYEDKKLDLKRRLWATKRDTGRQVWEKHLEELKQKYDFKIVEENIDKVVQWANTRPDSVVLDFSDDEKELLLSTWDGGALRLEDLIDIFGRNTARLKGVLQNRNNLMTDVENISINQELMIKAAFEQNLQLEEQVTEPLKEQKEQQLVRLAESEEINKKINVTDDEMLAYYESNKAEFVLPEEMEIWEIYVTDKSLADRISGWAKDGRDFAAMATRYSKDEFYAKKEGYLGYKRENTRGIITRKAFEIGENAVSEPVKYRKGWAVIKTGAKKPQTYRSFEDSRRQIKNKLMAVKSRERREVWEAELKDEYSVRINHPIVENI